MSIDLIGVARKSITPETIGKLSSDLGESPAGVQEALEGAVPTILAGMACKTSSGGGISSHAVAV